jgi:hypothetical protein
MMEVRAACLSEMHRPGWEAAAAAAAAAVVGSLGKGRNIERAE